MKKNIVIVGGGTAGWLAALYIQKNYKDLFKVTVVESSEIGILGAGEGSTPHLINFLESVNISTDDLVKHADATIKNAIKFTNWHNDGTHYYHGFLDNHDQFTYYLKMKTPLVALASVADKKSLDYYNLSAALCENNKVKFTSAEKVGTYSVHFNARMLADYLKEVGINRGITVFDSIVEDVTMDENMNINKLKLKDFSLDCDFVIDCTGFKRFFVNGIYKSPWKSYDDILPVNRAMPFFLDRNDEDPTPPYTESIAMKYGWVWKIPVRNRYGCGYVFDSRLISDEDAKAEIEEYFGHEISSPKIFTFSAGYHKKPWNKNCLSLGLSAGFIEPLEATSIWTTILGIEAFCERIHELDNQKFIDEYNEYYSEINDNILNFVHFHYLNGRNDTEFWNKFEDKTKWPSSTLNFVDVLNSQTAFNVGTLESTKYKYFSKSSWLAVADGMKFTNQELARDTLSKILTIEDKYHFKNLIDGFIVKLEKNFDATEDHNYFLNKILSDK